jgi:hypothetical protein
MGVVYIKPGVLFTKIAPGGFRILAAIDATADGNKCDLTITSACDGEHSGPNDPHHRGEAYDVRSHNLDDALKSRVLKDIQFFLGPESFFAFLEDPGTDNEHFHIQVKKDTVYPPSDNHIDVQTVVAE